MFAENTPSPPPLVPLPADGLREPLLDALRSTSRALVCAPTGSGKTTRVPPMLCEAMGGRQIVITQPRRLATRLVAQRLAEESGQPLGKLAGYRLRHQQCVQANTPMVVTTEGLLLRLLLRDPQLSGVGAVVLDEFHERTLEADMLLGILCELQRVRPDLWLVVMSATLDKKTLQDKLQAPLVSCEGRTYPVEVRHLNSPPGADIPALIAAQWRQLSSQHDGDALVFLPGAAMIRATERALQPCLDAHTVLYTLHGDLPPEQQDRAVRPDPQGRRRIILSTNVAETSITIPGIRIVIDSGLAREALFDPEREVTHLMTTPISRAKCDQRAGRAGRVAAGICMRLWTRANHNQRAEFDTPWITRSDLTSLWLTLGAMGLSPESLPWLTPPPKDGLQRARHLLETLGALDSQNALSPMGQKLATLPLPVRTAHALVAACHQGCGKRALLWAALLHQRDFVQDSKVFRAQLSPEIACSDLLVREFLLRRAIDSPQQTWRGISNRAMQETIQTHRQLEKLIQQLNLNPHGAGDPTASFLRSMRSRLAVKLSTQRADCQMTEQRNIELSEDSFTRQATAGPLLALDLMRYQRGHKRHIAIRLAHPLSLESIQQVWQADLTTVQRTEMNQRHSAEIIEEIQLDGLVLSSKVLTGQKNQTGSELLVAQLCSGQLKPDSFDSDTEQWIARARCVAQWFPERNLVSYDDDDMTLLWMEIVGDHQRFEDVRKADVLSHLKGMLDWDDMLFVEKMAPATLPLRDSRGRGVMRLSYTPGKDGQMPDPPRGSARVQQLFGLAQTPAVAAGRVAILLEILSPAMRPVQITSDLAGFWQRTYPQVRKDLKRRYPKHDWPEKPEQIK